LFSAGRVGVIARPDGLGKDFHRGLRGFSRIESRPRYEGYHDGMKRLQLSLLELLAIMFAMALIAAGLGIALRSVRDETPRSLLDRGRGAILYIENSAE